MRNGLFDHRRESYVGDMGKSMKVGRLDRPQNGYCRLLSEGADSPRKGEVGAALRRSPGKRSAAEAPVQ